MSSNKKKRKSKKASDDSQRNVVPIIKAEKPKKNRTLLTIVCIFVSIVVCFGGALITATLVRNARYVASYDGYGMDEGVVRYFASAYKMDYIANLPPQEAARAERDEGFWDSIPAGGDITYGEDLKRGFENYVRNILVASSLFVSLSDGYESEIEKALSHIASDPSIGGDIDLLNEKLLPYGFDYDDISTAAEMYYRYLNACRAVYGEFGERISVAGCSEYLKTYSHVKMIFVNSDSLANNVGGCADDIAALRSAMEQGLASEEQFNLYMKHNSINLEGGVDGEYYFHVNSNFTVKLGNSDKSDDEGSIHSVLERALTMQLGEFAEAKYPNGVCFIYKYEPEQGVYSKTDYEIYFEDFYTDAAEYLYDKEVAELLPKVKIKDSFYETDIVSIPKNVFYRVKF